MKKIRISLFFVLIFSYSSALAQDSLRVSATDWQNLLQRIERLEQLRDSVSPNVMISDENKRTRLAEPQSGDSREDKRTKVFQREQSTMDNAVELGHGRHRLTIGGYGEATMKRCFYSNNYLRYTSPDKYKNDQYGEFDLPHVVVYLGYDFGKGWSMGSEIEFEHGGTESAVEIEEEEGGEYESEVERGGEVALEQFWIQKRFNRYAVLRAGMIIVPLGGTNAHHEPNRFFGVYRPEGDNTILPCTWHDIGLQFSGRWRWLAYTAQFLPGLESDLFGAKNWIHYGSASPYEFKLANTYAGLGRLDFFPLSNSGSDALRISTSHYAGTSFHQNLTPTTNSKYDGVLGLIHLHSVDWNYADHHVIFRGAATVGHLHDADMISQFNKQMSKNSVSKRQNVAEWAYSAGAEVGYEFFHFNNVLQQLNQQFYLWVRYDIYDSQAKIFGNRNYWAGRQKVSCGFNYFPLPEIVVKGEFGYGILNQNPYTETTYKNEPYIALSINYSGFFKL
ncbi:MAG: hypothetical protein IJS13_10055 [Paludibacteraceae bacterium]|nr:hypothetical protein [Paludibacteraceae bacterium]